MCVMSNPLSLPLLSFLVVVVVVVVVVVRAVAQLPLPCGIDFPSRVTVWWVNIVVATSSYIRGETDRHRRYSFPNPPPRLSSR